MMRISPFFVVLLACPILAGSLQAKPEPSGPKNLIRNGGFESSFRRENLWDGVDRSGRLAGQRGAVPVLTTSGQISDSSMPISVGVADMNADGKADILAMDVLGYLHIYFNSGTPTEPKFTIGELAGIFLTRTNPDDPMLGPASRSVAVYARRAPRIYPTDIMGSGKKDLIIGNYIGEILLVPNEGSAQSPNFKQPSDISRLLIPTMKDKTQKWGNVFSPVTWDWNKDGKEDLLLGEGSYSANNIHLLLNQGSGAKPVFDETQRSVLAYGDGKEQLTPAVVDYDADGDPDILVSDRKGKVAVYLNSGKKPERGEPSPELPFASYINADGGSRPLDFGGITTIATGDLNGDGLFDIVVGKTNGRIGMTLNTGTKKEPKFGALQDVKGDKGTAPLAIPSGWDVDYGLNRGNFYGYISVVKVEDDAKAVPAEGKASLKAGYFPSKNKYMPAPATFTPALPYFKGFEDPNFQATAETVTTGAPAQSFMLRQLGRFRLKNNTDYTLSFKVKGNVRDGIAKIGWTGRKELSEAKVTKVGRDGVKVQSNIAEEQNFETIRFSSSPQWREEKKNFRVSFKDKDLKDLKTATTSLLSLSFTVPEGQAVFFDDFQLVERP